MSEGRGELTPAVIAERTRAYVRDNFLYMRPDWPLGDDDPLLESGVIDSIGVVELITFLQGEFGCTFDEEEIAERNLGSIAAIARFVHAKCNGGRVRAA
jgi:acyl carrier protein